MRKNLFDRIFEILSVLILLVATIFVLMNWNAMPDQIPSHYDFKGQVDAYSGKGFLIFTMVMGWVLVLSMIIISWFPSIWNTGVERTPANAAVVNRIIKDMLNVLEVGMAILFSYMMIVPAMGITMGKWFMPAFFIVIFGTIIVTVVRLIRNR
jgi:uncharacterized membrane protein